MYNSTFKKAVPATIAIINGKIKVGLNNDEILILADTENKRRPLTFKTSRRDMSYIVSQKMNGGTTVAGTLICAKMVGIKVFATGGIGGVHRGFEKTFDISADLVELGRSPVTVVSSGVKSILDIPKTLEYLETQGVFVGTYKATDHNFPAFYTRTSGIKVQYNFERTSDIARLIQASHQLNLGTGILIAVPVPEEFAMDGNCNFYYLRYFFSMK